MATKRLGTSAKLQTEDTISHLVLDRPSTGRASWSPLRRRAANIFESRFFELAMAVLIVINVILVAMETDHDAGNDLPMPVGVVKFLSGAVVVIYTVDLICRVCVFRGDFFTGGWNMFDMFVVTLDLVSLAPLFFEVKLPVRVSVLRILRLGRLLRSVQLLKIFHELYAMLRLMMSAVRAMASAAILVLLCLTLFSIVAVEVLHPLNRELAEKTDAYQDCERCARAFASVWESILTFFQQIIAGDSWGQVSLTLITAHPWTSCILMSAVFVINLGLLNLVVTVIIDRAQAARDENMEAALQEKEEQVEAVQQKFKQLCEVLDRDGSGYLSLEDLSKGMDTVPEFADILKLLDVRKEDLPLVFDIMDEDRSGFVSYDEFVWQLYLMKTRLNTHSFTMIVKAYVKEVREDVLDHVHRLQDEVTCQIGDVRDKISMPKPVETLDASRQRSPDRESALRLAAEKVASASMGLHALVDQLNRDCTVERTLAGTSSSTLAAGAAENRWEPAAAEGSSVSSVACAVASTGTGAVAESGHGGHANGSTCLVLNGAPDYTDADHLWNGHPSFSSAKRGHRDRTWVV